MKQAATGRLIFLDESLEALAPAPVLELPGPDLPRRQVFQPPLFKTIRSVTETRGFLDRRRRREIDDALGAAPRLSRGLADHIDEFRFIRHGWLPGVYPASRHSALCPLTRRFQNASLSRQP